MTARFDGELSSRRTARLDRHLAGCDACRAEADATLHLFDTLALLPTTAPVSERLAQNTLRAVRIIEAEAQERKGAARWDGFRAVAMPALSAAVVVALAVRATPDLPSPAGRAAGGVLSKSAVPAKQPRTPRVATGAVAARRSPVPATTPPPELAAAPDLFMELHILRNLEKLEHYDRIRTTTVDPDVAPPGASEQNDG